MHLWGALDDRLDRVVVPFLYDEPGNGVVEPLGLALQVMEPDYRLLGITLAAGARQTEDSRPKTDRD